MAIDSPLTKLWVCEHCGTLYELRFGEQPSRGWAGEVLCDPCAEDPVDPVEL